MSNFRWKATNETVDPSRVVLKQDGKLVEAGVVYYKPPDGDLIQVWKANASPQATFSASTSGLTVSVDASGSDDPDGSIASYQWDFGDGTTAEGQTASNTYSSGSTYTVTLTVTDDAGATDTASTSVSVSSSTSTDTTGENLVYTNATDLQAAADAALSGREPWASAWEQVKSDADSALSAGLESVTADGNGHDFTKDTNDRHDYKAAIALADHVRSLGLAHFVTGRDDYAQKAIEFIHHWCLDEQSYMDPIGPWSGEIEQFITIPALWYGAALVRGHPHWDSMSASTPWNGGSEADAELAFQQWTRDWAEAAGSSYENNIGVWWAQAEAAAWSYLQNETEFQKVVDRYKGDLTWGDYNDCTTSKPGTFENELFRSTSWDYSMFRVKAHMFFCEVARNMGYDMYNFNAPTDSCSGSTLKFVLDEMMQFNLDPINTWPYGTTGTSSEVSGDQQYKVAPVYEMAYSVWGDSNHLQHVRDVASRPTEDRRHLGWVTFTHGSLLEL